MYVQVLQFDSDRPFPPSFSPEDRDTFYRMKFKAMNHKLDKTKASSPQETFLDQAASVQQSLVKLEIKLT